MALEQVEREVITELIKLYRDLPCLWDFTSEAYKDSSRKKQAWDILATKLRAIDLTANAASAKKKIDNLRISYTRESKKVKESKKHTGSTRDVHKPSLWYYELMTFLEKKNKVKRRRTDSHQLLSDDEDERQIGATKRKNNTRERNIETKKEKLIDTANNLLTNKTEINAFGIYVGKKMEEILIDQQRDLAEKLISEIIFLAKTNNLTFDTKIDIPLRIHQYSASSTSQPSSSISSSSYDYIKTESPTSPIPNTQHSSPASSYSHLIYPNSRPSSENTVNITENTVP